jgi:hypothetical protein
MTLKETIFRCKELGFNEQITYEMIWNEAYRLGSGNVGPEHVRPSFEKSLEYLINYFSKESGSDTPDFILAAYLQGCLDTFNHTITAREKWYGRGDKPVEVDTSEQWEEDDQGYLVRKAPEGLILPKPTADPKSNPYQTAVNWLTKNSGD